jgi:uncharacterized protein
MTEKVEALRIMVDGMSCAQCEKRIETAVGALDGVNRVTASAPLSEVMVYYRSDRVAADAIYAAIRTAGYQVRANQSPQVQTDRGKTPGPESSERAKSVYRFLGLIAVVAAIYLIVRYTVGSTFLPKVSQSMGYGLIFVVGLLTSLHCIAMCGGIVLSQGISKKEETEPPRPGAAAPLRSRLMPSLLYNGGRVVSYTIIGGTVGALGSLFSLSTALKGAMPVIAGAFMLFLGVRMLGIFPWLSRLKVRMPGVAREKVAAAASRRGPFVVGLLNGLMPCGPLQTMQVYALGTGSFLAGAFSMFLFSLGTVPLLLGFGAISSLLSAKFNRNMVKASGVLVVALGLVMLTRGLNLFGVALPALPAQQGIAMARINGGYQEVRTTVESGQYHPFVVQAGIPVRWTISVKAADLNGCNSPVTIPQYGIRKQLVPGDNLVEFTPSRTGTIPYTCWMGMISSTIRVVADLAAVSAGDLAAPPADAQGYIGAGGAGSAADIGGGAANGGASGSCCAVPPKGFAGGKIPLDGIVLAKRTAEGQVVDVTVSDAGYAPAVVVVQKGVKAKIRFVAERLSACNSVVSFPEYGGGLDLSKGNLETPYLDVTGDFTFQCGMGMLHGYVKAVDDIGRVDLQAVRRTVAAYKPAAATGGCCGK